MTVIAGFASAATASAQPASVDDAADRAALARGWVEVRPRTAGVAVRDVTVQYRDLDIETRDGAAILLRRIRGAARQVCNPPQGPTDLQDTFDFRGCFADAVAQAVNEVDAPALAELYGVAPRRYARAYSYTRPSESR
jgi:UrcA family protein